MSKKEASPEARERLAKVFLDQLKSLLALREDEHVIRAWYSGFVECQVDPRSNEGTEDGFLLATDQRLLYYAITTPSLNYEAIFLKDKDYELYTPENFRLRFWDELRFEDIVELSAARAWLGKLTLRVSDHHRDHNHIHRFNNMSEVNVADLKPLAARSAKDLEQVLRELIEAHLAQLEEAPSKTGSVDYAVVRSGLEEKGYTLEALKCPSCGGSLPVPATGRVAKCAYCGSVVFVNALSGLERTNG
jgi:DNA-directed RNA polymerase subunit RPC12/RpoP